jgi:hypothetical protein
MSLGVKYCGCYCRLNFSNSFCLFIFSLSLKLSFADICRNCLVRIATDAWLMSVNVLSVIVYMSRVALAVLCTWKQIVCL